MMKINYQLELDKIINIVEGAGERSSVLLHSCCGPCSSYVVEYLTKHFDVTLLFYNPNIRPKEEYDRRLYWQRRLLEEMPEGRNVKIMECGYGNDAFEEAARGLEQEPEGGARCTRCFELRLEYTANLAAKNGFDFFCTTLTVSPHKDAQRINEIGIALAERYKVRWLPSDFKKRGGYKRSVELSEEYGLYRQNYCGCTPRE